MKFSMWINQHHGHENTGSRNMLLTSIDFFKVSTVEYALKSCYAKANESGDCANKRRD